MNRRRPEDDFCWDVPEDECPLPLVEDPALAALDLPNVPSPAGFPPMPNETLVGVRAGSPALPADRGWTTRFTAGVLATCLVAFGVGWTWGGELPTVDDSDPSSSTKGNAARQEWKEHRDD